MGGEGMQYVFVGFFCCRIYYKKIYYVANVFCVYILYVCSSLIIIIVVIKVIPGKGAKQQRLEKNVNVKYSKLDSWT